MYIYNANRWISVVFLAFCHRYQSLQYICFTVVHVQDSGMKRLNEQNLFSALQIFAPTDAFIEKLLAGVGAKRNLFTLDETLARKWILSSITRESCEEFTLAAERIGEDVNQGSDDDTQVKMLNQRQTFTCEGDTLLAVFLSG